MTGPVLPAPVLVVEDDALMRERLLHMLQDLGYAPDAMVFAASVAQARAQMAAQPHALALVDLGLPDGSGIDLIAELREQDPGLGILVISAWSTEERILNALRAGATGYVLKERDDVELLLAVRSVLRGGAPIDPFIARRILDLTRTPPSSPGHLAADALTQRESEILGYVAQGMTNREIAESIALSRHTVECHIKHIYRKLAVSSRTRAVHEARSRGWLD